MMTTKTNTAAARNDVNGDFFSGIFERIKLNTPGAGGFAYLGVDESQRRLVLAFRGSTNLENWVTDVRFIMTKWPSTLSLRDHNQATTHRENSRRNHDNEASSMVHSGWLSYFESMKDEIRRDLEEAVMKSYPGYEVWMTGHR